MAGAALEQGIGPSAGCQLHSQPCDTTEMCPRCRVWPCPIAFPLTCRKDRDWTLSISLRLQREARHPRAQAGFLPGSSMALWGPGLCRGWLAGTSCLPGSWGHFCCSLLDCCRHPAALEAFPRLCLFPNNAEGWSQNLGCRCRWPAEPTSVPDQSRQRWAPSGQE